GNCDLYVQLNAAPTTSSYLKRSKGTTNAESITINAPAAGTYYVMVHGYTSYSGVTLVATD
ncbi:MAG TPA: PPC domain-containing protein, partial [Burkholderiaceae bacterium]|nr:PPC domain-containing protein [Burkholderiaceae bacterium]